LKDEFEAELQEGMRQSLLGNKEAYEKLLKRISVMVRGYLFKRLRPGSQEKVEDLVQDVLVAIHRKKHLYRLDMPLLPWLYAIAKYRLIDHFRAQKRRPAFVEWDETFDPAAPEKNRVSDTTLFELEELLESLSPRQREILFLAKGEGLPLADIAFRFNMSLSAVKVTVHRALQKLREKPNNF
jgi:RNA polymerase sigma-70 factor (ECF subfamily)